ncbi:hypothetical protein SUGI_0818320 [Cryptomeria japonica]|nr:hypothetical protein SUGI_0818320 [Cryptomeria japonica]
MIAPSTTVTVWTTDVLLESKTTISDLRQILCSPCIDCLQDVFNHFYVVLRPSFANDSSISVSNAYEGLQYIEVPSSAYAGSEDVCMLC